jgi:hypothetical protein
MGASIRRLLVPAILGATVALCAADLALVADQSPLRTLINGTDSKSTLELD